MLSVMITFGVSTHGAFGEVTTEGRVKYFGRVLKGREADSFATFNV
jgi:hypothetical protein